jgi:Trypsin-like peptidase domain
MKDRQILFLGVIGVSFLTNLYGVAIAQNDTGGLEQIARETTVEINGQGHGSGVIVKRQGNTYWVLTAAHVVADSTELKVVTSDKNSHPVNPAVVQTILNNDLAILKFSSSQNYRTIQLGDSDLMGVGEPIFVSGFPAKVDNINSTTYKLSRGQIIAHASRALADGYALGYFNRTFAGMSGGPILNVKSQLVGIHGRAITMFSQNRGVNPTFNQKEGLNLGIPINTFLQALPKLNLSLGLPGSQGKLQSEKPKADDFLLEGLEKRASLDFKGASIAFDRAVLIQPKYAMVYFYRMEARMALRDENGAMADRGRYMWLTNFSKGSPYASVPISMKISPQPRNSDEKVPAPLMSEIDRSVQEDPDDMVALYQRGNYRLVNKDYKGAVEDYNKFLQHNPNSALRSHLFYLIGNAKLQAKDFRGAEEILDQAIREGHTSNYLLFCDRAEARFVLGDRSGAKTDLEKARSLYGSFPGSPKGFTPCHLHQISQKGGVGFSPRMPSADDCKALAAYSQSDNGMQAFFRKHRSSQPFLKNKQRVVLDSPKKSEQSKCPTP